MKTWVHQLDQLLRGEKTAPSQLRRTQLNINSWGVALIVGLLASSYGLCMGSFALARGFETGDSSSIHAGFMQASASMAKMPLLYLTTLCITFPSLYVFSALSGSQMRIGEAMRLLIAALAINLSVLASLGPIVAFFSVSTPSYNFVLLLNVACCAVAGILGLVFLLQTLYRLTDPHLTKVPGEEDSLNESTESEVDTNPSNWNSPGPLKRTSSHVLGRHVRKVFLIWIVVFGLVGAQMGWVLRPFIGSPNKEFAWLRPRDSNVFQAIWGALEGLFG